MRDEKGREGPENDRRRRRGVFSASTRAFENVLKQIQSGRPDAVVVIEQRGAGQGRDDGGKNLLPDPHWIPSAGSVSLVFDGGCAA
jgi:hypothetical protein